MTELFHDTATAAAFAAEKLKKVNLFASPRMFCDVYGLEPGQSQKPHVHTDSDKVYAVLTGECRVSIGEVERVLRAGQVAIAPAGEEHGLENVSGERTTVLVFMAPHPNYGA
jgi:quercetin dioxygenase-like cupin family protein